MRMKFLSTWVLYANAYAQALQAMLACNPKYIIATLAAFMLGVGGGALAIANLGSDAPKLPVLKVYESLQTPDLIPQGLALEQQPLRLYRKDLTRSSDTTESLFRRMGLNDPAAAAFIRQKPTLRQALLNQAGRTLSVQANEQQHLLKLTTRWLNNENDTHYQRLVITRQEDGFSYLTDAAPLTANVRTSGGAVASSLYAAADEARVPDSVTQQLVEVFSGQIDFHRALRKGAIFTVVYETSEAEGEPLRAGRILSAEFINGPKTYNAVWFQEPGKKGGYYSLEGQSLRRAYLASPMPYSRRTSGFGMREHPIFHTQRAHLGVDYAAPTGAPAVTVGNGIVEQVGFQNDFGNMVVVKHSALHSTVYAHLSRIQVRKGQAVRQGDSVGAVGATGWATGPHLHFEFRVNGRHVDPTTLALQAEAVPVSAQARAQFNQSAALARSQFVAAAQIRQRTFK